MPRPTNKTDLISQIKGEHEKLETLVSDLNKDEILSQKVTTNWTTKDVLAHLSEWTNMVLGWHKAGLKGKTPALPAEGFNWRQVPALNQQIYETYKDEKLDKVLENFEKAYKQILKLVESLSEKELYERSHYDWTGKNNFATYLISGSCSHYTWAYTRIKRSLRPKPKKQAAVLAR